MSLPFEFVKRTTDYDFFSPIINFLLNAAIITATATVTGTITYIALKTLGCNTTTALTSIALSQEL